MSDPPGPYRPDAAAPTANRLIRESSPYLKQHAHNPVDWYPWGGEALSRAKAEDRPILLSIGYSACHWCHVMERESFDDVRIARIMNEGFVCVKVDREERPDVDAVYMRAVQALTGRGGWPLTVFLTPAGEPFYGGTYFPPEPRQGMPSFPQVLEATREAWTERRGDVHSAAAEILELLERTNAGPVAGSEGESDLDDALLKSAVRALLEHLDPVHGGFGRAPKFPQPVVLGFLLERSALTGHRESLDGALFTLRKMARGGIRDHLGGGFHRYAVDQRWLTPHFEKMLYDNALLADAYLRAYQLTGDVEFERVCREVLEDMLSDFRSPEGGFYTARDADSEGVEGLFYLWTPGELAEHLDPEDARLFGRCYDVSEAGNFEGRNILHVPHDIDALAREEGMSSEALREKLDASRAVLRLARERREPPLRDEKILASWNALMLRTLADAGAALLEPRYTKAAVAGATWLLEVLRPDDAVFHQITKGEVRIAGFLDDVAGLGNALLSLHEATLEARWLELAVELDEEIEARFRDRETGLLYDTAEDGEDLVIRPRELTDSPIPSGSSLAAELKLRLGRLLGDEDRVGEAGRIVGQESRLFERMPSGFGRMLAVAGRLVASPLEIAIIGPDGDPRRDELLAEAHRRWLPSRVITGVDLGGPASTDSGGSSILLGSPLLEGRALVSEAPTAYVCRHFTCERPVTDPSSLREQLDQPAT